MISFMKQSRMLDSFARNITLCSVALLSSSFVPRIFHSLTCLDTCKRHPTSTRTLSHVFYRSHICFELLKNSLRAVVELYGADKEEKFPPIKVVVVEGKEDITIKISDEGGGIPRSAIPLIWTYMYTTMESKGLNADFQASDFKAPMAGFGYGLPLSRLVCLKTDYSLAHELTLTFLVCAIFRRRSPTNINGRIRD
jgi:hypothetical protein